MRRHEPNEVILINARDLTTDPEHYTNNINNKPVMAQRMTGSFTITNPEGDERSGDKGDWLVRSADDTLHICWHAVFLTNYTKKE